MEQIRWTIESRTSGSFNLSIVRATSREAAIAALGVAAHLAHDLTTPELVSEARRQPVGTVWNRTVDRLPSAYDRFSMGRGRMDWAAIEDAGFDVS